MAVTQGRTRQQIRQSTGAAIGALNQDAGAFTFAATGGTSSDIQASPLFTAFGVANEHRGKWLVVATSSAGSSNSAGDIRRVQTSETSSGRLTTATNFNATVTSSHTFELWDEDMPPQMINEFINQAITEVTRKGSVSVTYSSLHTGGGIREFPLDSAATGIQQVEYRYQYGGEQLTSLDGVMSSGSNTSVATDSEDLREGSAAAKITVAAGATSAAVIATSSFGTVNVSGYTHLEFWAKSNITTTASGLQVRLGEGSTARETIAMPALNADSWTRISLALANPEIDTEITRFIPMTGASDAGSMTAWFDDVTVVRENAERYMAVPRKFWSLDKANRTLRLSDDATVSYAKLRLNGVRKPNLLTADSAVSEIDSTYITTAVTAKALRARGDRRGANRDGAYVQADRYEALAQTQRLRMNSPMNIRWLDD